MNTIKEKLLKLSDIGRVTASTAGIPSSLSGVLVVKAKRVGNGKRLYVPLAAAVRAKVGE